MGALFCGQQINIVVAHGTIAADWTKDGFSNIVKK